MKEVDQDDYEVLTLILTKEEHSFFVDENNGFWRVYSFVENSIGYTYTDSLEILGEVGKTIGVFQKLLEGYPSLSLHETIKNFHNTIVRYDQLSLAYQENLGNRRHLVEGEIASYNEMKKYAGLLLDSLKKGEIPYRVTHNDTKVNNVLMDKHSGKGRCVIDLDTVMPGSCLFDYGDSIRSCSTRASEDEKNLDLVYLDLDRFEAFTAGYLEMFASSMNSKEIELMPYACIIMTIECGVRFLTDYLQGDVYFKVHHSEHNLDRARNQLKFAKDMVDKFDDMKLIIEKLIH
jgi:thiamine kinase-like enzyme